MTNAGEWQVKKLYVSWIVEKVVTESTQMRDLMQVTDKQKYMETGKLMLPNTKIAY
jgi:hypothetical protein